MRKVHARCIGIISLSRLIHMLHDGLPAKVATPPDKSTTEIFSHHLAVLDKQFFIFRRWYRAAFAHPQLCNREDHLSRSESFVRGFFPEVETYVN